MKATERRQIRKEFCINGHPRTPENLRPGRSDCAVCHREQELARNRAKGVLPRTRAEVCARRGHVLTEETRRPGLPSCAECHRLDQLERYYVDVEKSRKSAREYARQHKAEAKIRHKAWSAANADHLRKYGRDQSRARHAGRTPQGKEYVAILRNDPCSYCGGPAGHIDHIEPVAHGGSNSWDNLTAACQSCNSKKRTKPLLMFLLSFDV